MRFLHNLSAIVSHFLGILDLRYFLSEKLFSAIDSVSSLTALL